MKSGRAASLGFFVDKQPVRLVDAFLSFSTLCLRISTPRGQGCSNNVISHDASLRRGVRRNQEACRYDDAAVVFGFSFLVGITYIGRQARAASRICTSCQGRLSPEAPARSGVRTSCPVWHGVSAGSVQQSHQSSCQEEPAGKKKGWPWNSVPSDVLALQQRQVRGAHGVKKWLARARPVLNIYQRAHVGPQAEPVAHRNPLGIGPILPAPSTWRDQRCVPGTSGSQPGRRKAPFLAGTSQQTSRLVRSGSFDGCDCWSPALTCGQAERLVTVRTLRNERRQSNLLGQHSFSERPRRSPSARGTQNQCPSPHMSQLPPLLLPPKQHQHAPQRRASLPVPSPHPTGRER